MKGRYIRTTILEKLVLLFGYDGDIRLESNGVTYILGRRTSDGASLLVGNEQNRIVFRVEPNTVSHPVFEKFMLEAVKWASDSMDRENKAKEA